RAHSLAQEVNLNANEAEFRDIMISVQKQTGYSFIAKESLLKNARPVSIRVTSKDVKEVLPLLFRGQPFTYEINGRIITLKEIPETLKARSASLNKATLQEEVSGRVVDEQGQGLPGVS